MSKSFKEQSKINWSPASDRQATNDEIKVGCLQRIADAVELMAQNHNRILADLKFYKEETERLRKQRDKWQRSSAARAGLIKKLKGKFK